jgi:hypothetical protein
MIVSFCKMVSPQCLARLPLQIRNICSYSSIPQPLPPVKDTVNKAREEAGVKFNQERWQDTGEREQEAVWREAR